MRDCKDVNEILYDIKYGNLKNYIDNYNIELIKRILLIYIDNVDNVINFPINKIYEEIENINLDEEEF